MALPLYRTFLRLKRTTDPKFVSHYDRIGQNIRKSLEINRHITNPDKLDSKLAAFQTAVDLVKMVEANPDLRQELFTALPVLIQLIPSLKNEIWYLMSCVFFRDADHRLP